MAQPVTADNATRGVPRVINVDKNAVYPKAIADLKTAGVLPEHVALRQVKYLNNLIEQNHRFIKRLTKPGMGFFSFETSVRAGYRARLSLESVYRHLYVPVYMRNYLKPSLPGLRISFGSMACFTFSITTIPVPDCS